MTEKEIKICLERMSMGKTSDVMNFDYAGTLEYIKRLEAENAELKDQWDNQRCIYSYDGEVMEYCVNGPCPHDRSVAKVREENAALRERLEKAVELHEPKIYTSFAGMIVKYYTIEEHTELYDTPEQAEARLAELKGEKQ